MTAFAAIKGTEPEVEWLPCEALSVDHDYQRMIEGRKSQRLIADIAENWDWQLCGPLIVSRRGSDGVADIGYFIIDGQHRHAAAELRADVPKLPCIVYDFDSIEYEALCFVKINSARQPISKIDQFHARIAAKEELAIKIKKAVTDAGLVVTRYADAEFWKPREMAFPDAFGRKLEANQGAAVRALRSIGDAWPSVPLVRGKYIFEGAYRYLDMVAKVPSADELSAALRKHRQMRWYQIAEKYRAEHGLFQEEAMSAVLQRAMTVPPVSGKAAPRPARFATAGSTAKSIEPLLDGKFWCEQCEKRVSSTYANACVSQFCKAKAA